MRLLFPLFLLVTLILSACAGGDAPHPSSTALQPPTLSSTNASGSPTPRYSATSQLPTSSPASPPHSQTLTPSSSQPTILPATKSISEPQATLFAASPSLEILFDGSTCEIRGKEQLEPGEHVFLLRNLTGVRSNIIVGRLYPEKHWEDFIQWFDDNCGPPGSNCPGDEATWISWLFEAMFADRTPGERYFLYNLKVEGEYILAINRSDFHVWPCDSFQVAKTQ